MIPTPPRPLVPVASDAVTSKFKRLGTILRSVDQNHEEQRWRQLVGRGDTDSIVSPSQQEFAVTARTTATTTTTTTGMRRPIDESNAILHDFFVQSNAVQQHDAHDIGTAAASSSSSRRAPLISPHLTRRSSQERRRGSQAFIAIEYSSSGVMSPPAASGSTRALLVGSRGSRRASVVQVKTTEEEEDDGEQNENQQHQQQNGSSIAPPSNRTSRQPSRAQSNTSSQAKSTSAQSAPVVHQDDDSSSSSSSSAVDLANGGVSLLSAGKFTRDAEDAESKRAESQDKPFSSQTPDHANELQEEDLHNGNGGAASVSSPNKRNASHYIQADHRCKLNDIAARTLRQLALLKEAQEFAIDSERVRQMETVQFDEVHFGEQRMVVSGAPMKLRWEHLMRQPLKQHKGCEVTGARFAQATLASLSDSLNDHTNNNNNMSLHQQQQHQQQQGRLVGGKAVPAFFARNPEIGVKVPALSMRPGLTKAGPPSQIVELPPAASPTVRARNREQQAELLAALEQARYGATVRPRQQMREEQKRKQLEAAAEEKKRRKQEKEDETANSSSPKRIIVNDPRRKSTTADLEMDYKMQKNNNSSSSSPSRTVAQQLLTVFSPEVLAEHSQRSNTLAKRKFLEISNGGNNNSNRGTLPVALSSSSSALAPTQQRRPGQQLDVAAILQEVDSNIAQADLDASTVLSASIRVNAPTRAALLAQRILFSRDPTLFNESTLNAEKDFVYGGGMAVSSDVLERINRAAQRDERTAGIERGAIMRELLRRNDDSINPAAAVERRRQQDEQQWRQSYLRGAAAAARWHDTARKTASELGLTSIGIPRSAEAVHLLQHDHDGNGGGRNSGKTAEEVEEEALITQRMHQQWFAVRNAVPNSN